MIGNLMHYNYVNYKCHTCEFWLSDCRHCRSVLTSFSTSTGCESDNFAACRATCRGLGESILSRTLTTSRESMLALGVKGCGESAGSGLLSFPDPYSSPLPTEDPEVFFFRPGMALAKRLKRPRCFFFSVF